MNFGSKLFPLECTQAKKLTDGHLGRLVRHGRPHVRRTSRYPNSSSWACSGELKKIIHSLQFQNYMFLKPQKSQYSHKNTVEGVAIFENFTTWHLKWWWHYVTLKVIHALPAAVLIQIWISVRNFKNADLSRTLLEAKVRYEDNVNSIYRCLNSFQHINICC